jgi:hypothetical protein
LVTPVKQGKFERFRQLGGKRTSDSRLARSFPLVWWETYVRCALGPLVSAGLVGNVRPMRP